MRTIIALKFLFSAQRNNGESYCNENEGENEEQEEEEDMFEWQDEASDLSSLPKSTTTTSSKNFDCESGDEVEEMPESEAVRPSCGNKTSGSSTTESYSSVLEGDGEMEGDILNGNFVKLSPTDSESFTTSEQLTQRFVEMYVAEGKKEEG